MTTTTPEFAVTLDTDTIIGLPELFAMWETAKAEDDRIAALKKQSAGTVDQIRAAIEARLLTSGQTSVTDAATGATARIQVTTAWKVTDANRLMDAAKSTPELNLIRVIETVDTDQAIQLAKDGTFQLDGIELVTSDPFLKITPARGGK